MDRIVSLLVPISAGYGAASLEDQVLQKAICAEIESAGELAGAEQPRLTTPASVSALPGGSLPSSTCVATVLGNL
jgi:hypothetical protein